MIGPSEREIRYETLVQRLLRRADTRNASGRATTPGSRLARICAAPASPSAKPADTNAIIKSHVETRSAINGDQRFHFGSAQHPVNVLGMAFTDVRVA